MTKMVFVLAMFLSSMLSFAQVPDGALTFETNVKITNASSTQATKIQSAEEIIKKVIATEAFRNAVINHMYNGKKTFVDNGGLSNEQIYEKILEGSEDLNPGKNNAMDIEVELYYNRWTSTVGYTYPTIQKIYVNTKFFNSYAPAQVARNMFHEWLHKLGFTHASSYSTSRDYSVPYAIGSIIERLGNGSILIVPNDPNTPNTPDAPTDVPSTGTDPSVVTGPLTAPTNVTAASTGSTMSLSWSAATSSAGITKYKIYRRLNGSSTAYLQGETTGLTYSQVAPSKKAAYYVKAVDGDNPVSKSVEVTYEKVLVLTGVSDLTLTGNSTSVTLRWAPATSSEGVSSYRVYRRLAGSSTAYLQGTTTNLLYIQTSPSRSATYYVRAVDRNGNTVKSPEVEFWK